MPRTLYALLSAVDGYRPPVPPLNGCVNDIEAVAALLSQFADAGAFALDLLILKEAEATRAAVIDGFRRHLGKAGPEDVALFYYSGHGSQESAPPEFWHLEPDRLNETLVCYDSREGGQWDLADKELAVLIGDVAQSGPHVLCCLDCCHSGSGTRAAVEDGIAVRRAPTDWRQRPIEAFLDGALAAADSSRDDLSRTGWSVVPAGRHLLLAACRPSETAKEVLETGKPHGAFTAALLSALRQTGGSITYRDLLKRVEAQVRLRVPKQVPQVEASNPADLQLLFLGGAARREQVHFTLRWDLYSGWVIDGGAVHGIVQPAAGETTMLAIFDLQAKPAERRHMDAALAVAEVEEVRPELSRVKLKVRGAPLDETSTYRAIVVATPLPAVRAHLHGEPEVLEHVRQALASAEAGGASSWVHEVPVENDAEFRLDAVGGAFHIGRAGTERSLVAEVVGLGRDGAKAAVARLEHLGRWEAVARLANPASRFEAEPVEVAVLQPVREAGGVAWREADPRRGIRLEYQFSDAGWEQPKARIELRNKGREAVYCALLWLGEDYSVSSALIPGGTVHIPPGGSVAANGGEPVWGFVPDDKWRRGCTEVRDLLKLIVSTEQFDPTLFEQVEIERHVVTRGVRKTLSAPRNALERLAARVHHRGLATRPGMGETIPDWATGVLPLTVMRPLEAAEVPGPDGRQALGAGVTLFGHPTLKAKARLASSLETGRGLDGVGLPAVLRDDPDASQPFLFVTPRGTDSGLGTLQLSDISDPGAVTADAPLVLQVQTQIGPGEHILPFAWDGEFFLPLGKARQTGDGVLIEVRQLPRPLRTASDVERGIVSSVRIMFQKLLSSKLGTAFDYPRLAAVVFGADGQPGYETGTEAVRDRVASAERILLYVHGILGDTSGMTAASLEKATLPGAPQQRIADCYDLVLAFDYENINTGIDATAKALKERLERVGIGPGHSKTLHVAAHSMGGLVARWFIEREGGAKVVQHLVTLGTPHAGSPWPTLQDWAIAGLALALNGFAHVGWPVKLLGDLVAAAEAVDVTLDQMAPGSALLADLARSDDPAVSYTLLAGNTSVIAAALDNGKAASLLERLAPQRVLHAATSLAFLRAPNDIAVSVVSAKGTPDGRSPPPRMEDVGCDHLTFFSSEAGRQALLGALLRA